VYGSEAWADLTVALINAVLEASAAHRVVDVELLNPYSEKMTLDDKLSILDIKARDQAGWLFNVEMQMLALAALAPRLLYYWANYVV
jgi:predicted transposase/invertase (TIGR01784 family)